MIKSVNIGPLPPVRPARLDDSSGWVTVRAGFIIPRDTKPDVRVRVRRGVVQIQRQHASVAAIVPIATADEATQGHL